MSYCKDNLGDSERGRLIGELVRAVEDLISRRVRREEVEGLIDEARVLAGGWKDSGWAERAHDRRALFDATGSDVTVLLGALVVLLRESHWCLEKVREYCPNELEKLISASDARELRGLVSALGGTVSEFLPKRRKYERKRRRWRRNFFNSIEYQFGGDGEEDWRKSTLGGAVGESYEPWCLAEVLAWGKVNMRKLEELFGFDRHRLGGALGGGCGKRRYGHGEVVKIMDSLLGEPRRRRRRGAGRPRRAVWLAERERRARVLRGIEERIERIATELRGADLGVAERWRQEIALPFLDVVRWHMPKKSGKKSLSKAPFLDAA